ncbi:protein C1orf43 homolog [Babylonia areolata]|uniref:protein C1orf43 homolog n=1 Tax=Babylonia areolata TaxID=304850 RepID=UPI003FD4766E
MAADLPVVTIVLFIASGALVFCLLFLFAKRQIMRFALKSARKPHIAIGADAPKEKREEIQRRLGLVQNVRFEPTLLSECIHDIALSEPNHFFHRMKALDAFTNAVECCRAQDRSISLRSTKQTIQLYLFSLCPSTPSTPLAHVIHQFSCAYNHARHNPATFADAEFTNYMELLDKVIRMIKSDKKRRLANMEPPLPAAIDTEVRIRKGASGPETLPHHAPPTSSSSSAPAPTSSSKRRKPPLSAVGSAVRPEHLEQISLVDKSSGYSSTDHSSSGRGSVERLISPQLTVTRQEEEAV